ncbi:MAG: hypothetical protein ACI9ES_002462 [Oceanospirillaceae bacterium]|jgi:hypothetical protein
MRIGKLERGNGPVPIGIIFNVPKTLDIELNNEKPSWLAADITSGDAHPIIDKRDLFDIMRDITLSIIKG